MGMIFIKFFEVGAWVAGLDASCGCPESGGEGDSNHDLQPS